MATQPLPDETEAVGGGREGRYLSIRDFAIHSGFSEKTVRRLVQSRKVPFLQPGGPRSRIRLPLDALEGLVIAPESNGTGPMPERRVSSPHWKK